MKTKPNKVKILKENGDKLSQNTHVEVNIFAEVKTSLQKSKAPLWAYGSCTTT